MRPRFEFTFVAIADNGDPNDDVSLTLLGSQGWELRGIAAGARGGWTVALQRPIDEEHPLPERDALAATLEAPLVAPGPEEFEAV